MAMDTVVATLACCLLALSFAVVQTQNNNVTVTTPAAPTDFNLTQPNSMAHVTDTSTFSEDTTQYTGTTEDKGAFTKTTAATNEGTSQPQMSQSTAMSPRPTSLKATTPSTQTPTFTTQTNQTAADSTSTTENSSYTVSATSQSVNRTTKGLGLNPSEKNMTIVFSAVLGVFGAALLMFMVHKCKHKIQFIHQPLHNTDNTDVFVADDDTLVISGGLYDGHPIYDNVPPVSGNQSQFRLEFI